MAVFMPVSAEVIGQQRHGGNTSGNDKRQIAIQAKRRARLLETRLFVLGCHRICLVFSFELPLPPDAVLLRRLAHAAYTVHANVIFWHPSSAALRNARRGSSVAYVQYINTVPGMAQ